MEINELLEFLKDDDLTNFIEIVKEPEYSKEKLLSFQNEFGMSSIYFYELYVSGLLENQLHEDKMNEWAYNYKIFVKTNGDLSDLISITKDNKEEGEKEFHLLFLLS